MKKEINNNEIIICGSAAYLSGVQAAVTFSEKNIFEEPLTVTKVPAKGTKENRGAVPWGEDNVLPKNIIEVVGKNPIASRCIEFKIEVSYGSGVKAGIIENETFREFTAEEKAGKYSEIATFFEDNDLDGMFSELCTDMHWFNNGFVEFILNQDTPESRKIVEMSAKEAAFSRWETSNPETGNVENHFYSSFWPTPKAEQYEMTPVIWQKNLGLEIERRIGRSPLIDGTSKKDENIFRYIVPVRLPSPSRKYYPEPYYYSIIQSGWLEFANAIPTFKKALMTNSITIAYHIEISQSYFPRIFREEGIKTAAAMKARQIKEFQDIENFLKGAEKAGKTFISYTKSVHGVSGKMEEVPEITIKVIDKKLGGEFIEDSHEASAMTFIAFGVHPSMIGIIPGKTSSNLSGTDKRELLRISQSLQARVRSRMLKPLYAVKRINKWPAEVEFSISDIILTTLDQGREVQKVNSL